jgi:hypothetical protein
MRPAIRHACDLEVWRPFHEHETEGPVHHCLCDTTRESLGMRKALAGMASNTKSARGRALGGRGP